MQMKQLKSIETMKNTCMVYGRFDGMHKGHQAVVKELVEQCRREGRISVVISLASKTKESLLTEEEKAELLEKAGVDVMISCYEEEYQEKADVKEMLRILDVRSIVLGRESQWTGIFKETGIPLKFVKTVTYEEKPLSTERLEKCLKEGDAERFKQMTGRSYQIEGIVVHGKALGRTVGMPTANLDVLGQKKKPAAGVYGTRNYIGDDTKVYLGVTNIGTRPTVDDLPVMTIETMLLDFDQDIYGKTMRTEICCFLRGIHKFENLRQVQQQVKKDAEKVWEELGEMHDLQ